MKIYQPRPHVFISHSAKDHFAEEVLRTLYQRLEEDNFEQLDQPAFEVLLDKEKLQPGDEWRRKLFSWIFKCNAAVVLFSEDTLESHWVRFEASCLIGRLFLEPDFILIPIILAPVRSDDLKTGPFAPMQIDALQAIRGNTAQEIVEQVVTRLSLLHQRLRKSPLQELERVIQPWLKLVEPERLRTAAREIGVDPDQWPPTIDPHILLVRELLAHDLSVTSRALAVLAPQMSRELGHRLVDRLAPLWVDPRAATIIQEVVKRTAEHWALGINAHRTIIGQMYVWRACCSNPAWKILTLNNQFAEDQLGTLIREIRAAYRAAAGVLADDDIVDFILQSPPTDEPVIVIVPGFVDNEILDELRNRYPGVRFFLMTGDEVLDNNEPRLHLVEFLHPPLTPRQEKEAYACYLNARTIVGGSS